MKVAILGAWHVHADDYVKVALKLGEVVGVYDSNAERRTKFAQKYSIPEFTTAEELFASDAQGVICCSATNEHKNLIIAAANAGKHIFTEKVLALTQADCEEIRDAVEKNGVNFVISFPWKSRGGIRSVKKAVDEGVIGKPNYMRFRNCHDGSLSHWLPEHFYSREQCGGGAMIDLGAHGMYLTHWIMGEPSGYKSSFEHFCRDEKDALLNKDCVEDNAVTVMSFDNGAIAINETGFVSKGCPVILEVGGTRGHITLTGSELRVCFNGNEFHSVENCTDIEIPIEMFVKGEIPESCGIEEAIVLTRMMEKAYKNV